MRLRHHSRLLVIAFSPFLLLLPACRTLERGADAQLGSRLDGILDRHADSGAHCTARVLLLPERRELYARDIDTAYVPASNLKLVVSAAALDMFGPEHTFDTILARQGDDLYLIGGGDPALGDPRIAAYYGMDVTSVFDDWSRELKRQGVTTINGNLYYDATIFDQETVHPTWDDDDLVYWYAAPVSGLNFNDNCIDLTVYPTCPGEPVGYELAPPTDVVTIINNCTTGEGGSTSFDRDLATNRYALGGSCNAPNDLPSRPVVDPAHFTADVLRKSLASNGISIVGDIRPSTAPPLGDMTVLARCGTAMKDVIWRLNKPSQNLFAEAACKLTGRAFAERQGRDEPGSWRNGGEAIHAFLEREGIDTTELDIADGSGLSHENHVTGRLITDLLATMSEHSDGDVYRESLAVPGRYGTLRRRLSDLVDRVYAKTGYISGTRSLSGYVRTDGGQWLCFAIIFNDIPGSVKPYERLQDEVVELLAHWPQLPADSGGDEG